MSEARRPHRRTPGRGSSAHGKGDSGNDKRGGLNAARCGARWRCPRLTDRELEVPRLLAADRSNQSIAHDLVVTLDTAKKHMTHILGKLGAANRTEAAARPGSWA